MSLVGSLEDLGLGDILQIVSLARKSGILSLRRGEVRGKIVFKDGLVVAALSSEIRDSLAEQLVSRGLITPAQVQDSAHTDEQQEAGTSLKDVIVTRHKVSREGVDQVIKDHVEGVVFGFFDWPDGNFSFELTEVEPEIRNLKKPWRDFVLDMGLSPQYLAMEGTRRHDERRRDEEESPVGPVSMPYPEEMEAESSNAPTSEDDFSSVNDYVRHIEERGKPEPKKEVPPPSAVQPQRAEDVKAAPTEEQRKAPSPEPAPARREAAPAPAPGVGGPPIIVVDDDPFLLESLNHHLVTKGYDLHTFSLLADAQTKWQQLEQTGSRFIIIADLIMPSAAGGNVLGGLDFLKTVKSRNQACQFWLMTDYENDVAQKQAKQMGVNYFFFKPKSSQLDEDYSSPELLNFIAVLENALQALPREAGRPSAEPGLEGGLYNLAEELSKEMGEEEFGLTPAPSEELPSRGISMLKSMINELNDPSSSGQITLLVLRFAAVMMNRAVIFLVAKNQLAGLGQFGIDLDGKDPEQAVRRIRIPLDEPSIFQETIRKRMPLKKSLKHTRWNDYLVDRLGGSEPKEVFVAPIISSGRIAAILYGDNIPEQREIGDTESLEIFLAQAGLAMEKALLERRLSELRSDR